MNGQIKNFPIQHWRMKSNYKNFEFADPDVEEKPWLRTQSQTGST